MNKTSRLGWWIGLIGAVLALVGLWGTWVPHKAAALVLSGWDLTEFIKFLPGTSVARELFYLPVWCGGLTLVLMAHRLTTSPTKRAGVSLLALVLMAALLPPYPHVFDGYKTAEFRWRFVFGASGALLVLVAWFSRRWSERFFGGLLTALAFLGLIPPLGGFLAVRGTIENVYGSSLGWGWGLGLFLVGWGLVALIGVRMLLKHLKSQEPLPPL
jgi:hypothetical protein